MAVLTSNDVLNRLYTSKTHKRLTISPLIDIQIQIGAGSIDIRLGTKFITTKKTKLTYLDPMDHDITSQIDICQDKMHVNIGARFTLHPRQLVLAGSLEYIRLPNDLIAYVDGRSSWGRIGLIVATATLISPGFSGIITFELVNHGETPIVLYPGARIAQMVLHTCESPESKSYEKPAQKRKYSISTEPEFSKIHDEYEWEIFRQMRREE